MSTPIGDFWYGPRMQYLPVGRDGSVPDSPLPEALLPVHVIGCDAVSIETVSVREAQPQHGVLSQTPPRAGHLRGETHPDFTGTLQRTNSPAVGQPEVWWLLKETRWGAWCWTSQAPTHLCARAEIAGVEVAEDAEREFSR